MGQPFLRRQIPFNSVDDDLVRRIPSVCSAWRKDVNHIYTSVTEDENP